MKLPSSTMGFARVSFPLIRAGGVWQCRYSCILWAPKLWPPIWIQAFQIVKWHSSFFLCEVCSMTRILLGFRIFSLTYQSLLWLTHSSAYMKFLCLLSFSTFSHPSLDCLLLSDFNKSCFLERRAPVTNPSSPAVPSCPHPHPIFPWIILRRHNTIRRCEIKYITPFQIKVFLRQLLIHITL